jgi:hypothetical protein
VYQCFTDSTVHVVYVSPFGRNDNTVGELLRMKDRPSACGATNNVDAVGPASVEIDIPECLIVADRNRPRIPGVDPEQGTPFSIRKAKRKHFVLAHVRSASSDRYLLRY